MNITEFLFARIPEDATVGRRTAEAMLQVVVIASAGVAAVNEGRPHRSFLSGRVHDSANILAALALPYADHPDWREEWRT